MTIYINDTPTPAPALVSDITPGNGVGFMFEADIYLRSAVNVNQRLSDLAIFTDSHFGFPVDRKSGIIISTVHYSTPTA